MTKSASRTALQIAAAAGLLVGCAATTVAGEPHTETIQTIITNDNGQTYKIVIKDGKVSAWANGEKVDADHISKDDGRVIILDDDGNIMQTFRLGGNEMIFAPEALVAQAAPPAPPASVEPPRPVIGVTVRETTDDDGESTIVIESVREGLPADRAGIKTGDTIVKIQGAEEVSTRTLLERIAEAGPGGELKVTVVSEGDKKPVLIKLDPAPPRVATRIRDERAPRGLVIEREKLRELERLARRQAVEQDQKARAFVELHAQKADEHAQKWVQAHGHEIDELRAQADQLAQQLELRFGEFKGPDGDVQFFTVPDFNMKFEGFQEMAEAQADQLASRIDDLEGRLDDLNDRLDDLNDTLNDRLETMFEHLQETIERLQDDE